MRFKVVILGLSNKKDLFSDRTLEQGVLKVPSIEAQLRSQGRMVSDSERYRVDVNISQGIQTPAYDLDNYIKPILDSITYTKLVWIDDWQIDEISIKRSIDQNKEKTDIEIFIENI
jgi:Holliday junction resolvase RusA-like endonuclease